MVSKYGNHSMNKFNKSFKHNNNYQNKYNLRTADQNNTLISEKLKRLRARVPQKTIFGKYSNHSIQPANSLATTPPTLSAEAFDFTRTTPVSPQLTQTSNFHPKKFLESLTLIENAINQEILPSDGKGLIQTITEVKMGRAKKMEPRTDKVTKLKLKTSKIDY